MRKTIPFPRFRALLHFLVVLSCLLLATNSANAQNISVDLKNVSIKEILKAIEKQTDLTFVYNNNVVDVNKRASLSVTKSEINAALDLLLKNTGYGYKIVEKQIIISPLNYLQQSKKPASGEKIDSPDDQNGKQSDKTIKGTVVDENNQPFPGVSIQNVTTKKATFSGINGEYALEAKAGDRLIFSSIGMLPKEITYSGKVSIVNIAMAIDNIALQDVVVTGYQTISKERATGSFNIIKAEQLEKPSTNLGQRIIGTSAGVQAKTDADGNVTFEIRGQTSLAAAAQPLVVVDGFAIQGNLSSLNPNDVESITILKDAAATSIWGARSANGVIVVTSKSGKGEKQGGVKVDFSTFFKYSPKTDINYQNPYASSSEIIDYEQKGFATEFFGGPWSPISDSNSELTGSYSAAVEAMNENRLGYLSTADLNATLDRLRKIDNRGQIKKYMLQNPFSQQYNLNISSSSEKISNVLSLMYEGSDKNYQGGNDKKYIVNYRSNAKVFKWLDLYFSGAFSMKDSKNNDQLYTSEAIYSGTPYQQLINEDGTRANVTSTYYWPNIKRYVPYKSFPYSDWSYNPISENESRNFSTKTYNARVQGGLTIKIIKGLTFDSKIQYEILNTDTRNIYNESSFTVRSTINQASSWDRTTNTVTANLPKGGFLDQNRSYTTASNWRNQVNFDREFNEKHQISFIAGSEISDRVYQTVKNPRTYGYNDEKLTVGTFPNGVGGSGVYKLTDWEGWSQTFPYTNSYSYSTDRYLSMYANASYTFDRKYTLSGSARTDASNLITDDPKYRYAPFWSVGASWAISKENFLQQVEWLDRLSLRATYGFNGNVDKSTSFMPLISVGGTQNSYIQDYTASISSFGNPTLRWEKTGTFDIGTDFDLFRGKLYGKIDVYNKKGKDLIVSMSIPAVNGTTSQKLNMAEMTNRGIEIELGSTMNIKDNDIVWNGNFNFSYNKNKIDKLFKATYSAYELYDGGTSAYVQGYDANTLWSFKYAGVVNKGTEASPNWQPVVQGKGEDLYDFTGWTPGDGRDYMLNMGTKVAPYSIGFSNSFKIYDFDLSFIITGKFGHVFNGFSFNYPNMSDGGAIPNKLYQEILKSNPSDRVPIPFGKSEPRYYFWDRFYPYLDYLVQNANHIRMQELNITYNMPKKLLKKIGINSAKIYVQGNNLFIITNNKYNEDPEFPMGTLRPQAAFTFGLNLGL